MPDLKDFGINAVKQSTGGKANYKGITFQIFASTIQVARFAVAATEGRVGDVYFQAEDPDARVDDLTVVSDNGLRWHFQMKAVESQRWDHSLVEQFKEDRTKFPRAQLFLICHSAARLRALIAGLEDAEMEFVRLGWADFSHPEYAYRTTEIRHLLDQLSPVPNSEDSYFVGWKNLLGIWVMASKGRLSELLWGACVGSNFTIRQLQAPSARSIEQLTKLRDGMSGLKIEISKGMLVISDNVISTIVPIIDPPQGADAWWQEAPTEGWGLYKAVGGLRDE